VLLQANQVVGHLPGDADCQEEPVFLGVPLNSPPVGRQFPLPAPGEREIEIQAILGCIAGPGAVRGEERRLDLAVDLDLALERGLEIGERDGGGGGAVGRGGGAVEEAEEAGALGAEEVERVQLGLAHAGGRGVGGGCGGGEADGGRQADGGRAPEGDEEDEEEEREGDKEHEVAAGPEDAPEGGGGGGERRVERGDAEGGGRRAGTGGGGRGLGMVLRYEGLEVVLVVGDGRAAVHGGGGGVSVGSEQRGRGRGDVE